MSSSSGLRGVPPADPLAVVRGATEVVVHESRSGREVFRSRSAVPAFVRCLEGGTVAESACKCIQELTITFWDGSGTVAGRITCSDHCATLPDGLLRTCPGLGAFLGSLGVSASPGP